MKQILYCKKCESYTMKEVHDCSTPTVSCKPAKWSPEDKYGKYRREAKREERKKKGLA